MKCVIDEQTIKSLIKRYDGIGKPLTRDEEQILMAALYFESEQRGGIVVEAQKDYLRRMESKEPHV